jgi:hypothetical protein
MFIANSCRWRAALESIAIVTALLVFIAYKYK